MSNAQKAATWLPRFCFQRTITNGPPEMDTRVVNASQTIRVGDPLILSSNKISVGVAGSAKIYGVSASNVVTTAADEGYLCSAYVANDDNVFTAQCDAASTGITDGATCDIIASGTSWLLDIGASATDVVLVKKHVDGDDITDATDTGRLEFVWNKHYTDGTLV